MTVPDELIGIPTSTVPTFQLMARSWLGVAWLPFSRPSLAVTSTSTTSVTTPRTASWAAFACGIGPVAGSFGVLPLVACLG